MGVCYPYLHLCIQVTIKAVAVSGDGNRESSVVTKTFFVEEPSQKEVEEEDGEEEEVRQGLCYTHSCHWYPLSSSQAVVPCLPHSPSLPNSDIALVLRRPHPQLLPPPLPFDFPPRQSHIVPRDRIPPQQGAWVITMEPL